MTEGFEDFLRERREHSEQTRRLLIGVLALTCIALAISNVVLALWLTSARGRAVREAPPRVAREAPAPAGETSPPAPSIPSRAENPPPAVTLPKTAESAPDESRGTSAASASDARTAPPLAAEHPVPASGLPPRSGAAAPPPRPPSPARVTTEPAPSDATPAAPRAPGGAATEQATAAWMLTTYGRTDAESRARAALRFYDPRSAEGRYWRRVLALIVASR